MSAACGFHFFDENDEIFLRYLGEFYRKYGYTGAFNGFDHCYPSPEARWAFLARMGYLLYECHTGQPYYDLMGLLRGKSHHIMTTNQGFQFSRGGGGGKAQRLPGGFPLLPVQPALSR